MTDQARPTESTPHDQPVDAADTRPASDEATPPPSSPSGEAEASAAPNPPVPGPAGPEAPPADAAAEKPRDDAATFDERAFDEQARASGGQSLEQEIAEALGDVSMMDLVGEEESVMPATPDPLAQAGDHAMAKGRIVAIHEDDVFVELGGKSQGIVPLTQFEKPPEIGSTMEFIVEGLLGDEGLVKLSRQGAVEKATWQSLQRGMVIEAHVSGSNTGGLELKVAGQRAFMPASQIDLQRVENFTPWLGTNVKCKVIELDKRAKKIVVSRRAVLEEEAKAAREELLGKIEPGQVLEGTVRNIKEFGAFVDLGGIDGLVHISDLSYGRVKKVEEVVNVGDKVRVKVLKIEKDGERISLGMKQVEPDPWDAVQVKYHAGDTVTGRVTKLTNFGAFVELEPGIEGLIPMGELSWDRVARPSQIVQEDQQVTVKVLEVDAKRQRIGLSLKQLGEDPWVGVEAEFAPDTEVEGTVTRTAEFGAFVELKPGVEGMIHISELSDKRTEKVEHAVKPGQTVKAKVLSVDPKQRRIGLSIKALIAPEASGGPRGKASREDMKKYVVREQTDKKKATSGTSLGSLLDKFGEGGGGLKGGIG